LCSWHAPAPTASSPDDFPASFFKQFWPIVKKKIVSEILGFFSSGVMANSWKHTFIASIPKCNTPTRVEHFRPISLCNTLYKLVAKILVRRMKGILNELISLEQGAFVPERVISDNILID